MDMIESIVTLLASEDWLIGDEDIDIAKGKYELPETWKEYRLNKKRWHKSL
jgi:hypothetical protein